MNAVPPKNQMPAKGAPADDHIHLTMSFEDDDTLAPEAHQPLDEGDASPSSDAADAAPAGGPSAAHGSTGPGPAKRTEGSGRSSLLPQFGGIELSLTVEVGSLNITLKDLMSVEPGRLLALDRLTTEPVTVLVNGKAFARGEIVAIGDRYGVRLLEIVSPAGGDG